MPYIERSQGAYSKLSTLANFQLASKSIPLKKNKRAFNHINGPIKTPLRGRGMEFEDVRLYQAGDDIRAIDWRVTARTRKTHTKQFREEREKPVFVVVDQRQSMFFGSKVAMKSVVACDYAAYIAWAAFHKGDKVGGLVFNDDRHCEIKPRQQRKTILQFLQKLVNYNALLNTKHHPQRLRLASVFLEIKRIAKPGSQIFFISDFHDLDENCEKLLFDLSKHCEITAVQIYDPIEERLPKAAVYKVNNGDSDIEFDTRNLRTRKHYLDQFKAYKKRVNTIFTKFAVPVISCSTQDLPLALLQKYFGRS